MDTQDTLEKSILLYVGGTPMLGVCAKTGISFSCLQRHLQKRGLSRSNKDNSRKYTVNHSYFKTINTEAKAYWLGFFYADGYVSRECYVGLSLSTIDKCHLEKLQISLNANYPIKTYTGRGYGEVIYSRLVMTSREMYADLVFNGVIPHKTLILQFPSRNIVPTNLIRHFIRGYFDGDGSFSKASKLKNGASGGFKFKLCGTREFLTETLKHIGHPDAKLYQRWKNRNNNNFQVDIGGMRNVKKIASYLYDDATIYLDRKYELYKEIMAYQGGKLK